MSQIKSFIHAILLAFACTTSFFIKQTAYADHIIVVGPSFTIDNDTLYTLLLENDHDKNALTYLAAETLLESERITIEPGTHFKKNIDLKKKITLILRTLDGEYRWKLVGAKTPQQLARAVRYVNIAQLIATYRTS